MADSVFMGRGDVNGPASATDGALAAFDGITGKLIKVASASGVYVSSITGTANQVIASAATGAVVLSLPQDIATTSSPTFANPIVSSVVFSGGQSLVGTSADTTELYRSTNAQSLLVYGTRTSASVFERLAIVGGTTNFIRSETTGGTYRAVTLEGLNVNLSTGSSGGTATARWRVDSSGNFIGVSDNAYDIGASGATRPRTGYFGTSVVIGNLTIATGSTSILTAAGGTGLGFSGGGNAMRLYNYSALMPDVDGTGALGGASNRFTSGYFNTSVVVGSQTLSTTGLGLVAGADIEYSGRARLRSTGDGLFSIVNNTATAGVLFNVATDATLKLFARDGTSAASLLANNFQINTAGGTINQTGGSQITFPSNGTLGFADASGNGVRASLTAGQIQFLAFAGADTAIVKANKMVTTLAATFHTTAAALTDGAGAGAGTITNAPSAGNPTKWIGIDDNGTVRYLPAW